jgi:hypothetical protein
MKQGQKPLSASMSSAKSKRSQLYRSLRLGGMMSVRLVRLAASCIFL